MHHRSFRLLRFGLCFTGLLTGLVAAGALPASAQTSNPTVASVVLKPGVDLPRAMVNRLKRISFPYSALAMDTAQPSTWHISNSGLNSVRAAAEVARLTCNAKARPGHFCEVVALKLPSAADHSFASAMTVSGASSVCIRLLTNARRPSRRPAVDFNANCPILFLDEQSDFPNQNRARQPGYTLYFARNDLWSGAIAYGPDPAKAKSVALDLCRSVHASVMAFFVISKQSRSEHHIGNVGDFLEEASAIYAVGTAQAQLGRCRIVGTERLP